MIGAIAKLIQLGSKAYKAKNAVKKVKTVKKLTKKKRATPKPTPALYQKHKKIAMKSMARTKRSKGKTMVRIDAEIKLLQKGLGKRYSAEAAKKLGKLQKAKYK